MAEMRLNSTPKPELNSAALQSSRPPWAICSFLASVLAPTLGSQNPPGSRLPMLLMNCSLAEVRAWPMVSSVRGT